MFISNMTEEEFNSKFFDVRKHKLQKGQVIARFTAMADLIEAGFEKRNLVDLLRQTDKAEAAAQVMRKLFHSAEPDCYRVPKEIAQDLISGLSVSEVLAKPYRYKIELFYYTEKDNIPENHPHWSCISLLNLDEFLKQTGSTDAIAGKEEEAL
jgi:hypothetical protein